MAIFGFNIVITLIASTILQKLLSRTSIGHRLLARGLLCYLPPSTDNLRSVAGHTGNAYKGTRRRKKDRDINDADGFLIPKNANIELIKIPIRADDVLQLPLFSDYRWLIDFTFVALIVYIITELYNYLFNLDDRQLSSSSMNLSTIWLFFAILLCFRSLTKLTSSMLWTMEEAGERSVILCFGTVYFLLVMCFIITADHMFDLEFESAYRNFTSMSHEYLQSQNLGLLHSERSPIVFYVILAGFFGALTGMLVFPNFRYAKMYLAALKYGTESPFRKLILHLSFLSPLLVLILWAIPFKEHLISGPRPLVSLSQLETLRLYSVLLMAVLRIGTYSWHLQAHLNSAFEKMVELRQEIGRINSLELQRMVIRIFSYLCAASLQYFVPVLMQLIFVLLLKTLGHYSWFQSFGLPSIPLSFPSFVNENKIHSQIDTRHSLASIYQLFNVTVNRGFWQFILMTTIIINFSLSSIGVAYNSRFTQAK